MRTLALPLGTLLLSLSSALATYGQTKPATSNTEEASPLQVEKVEPPSWWRESTISPIRLLLTGTGFAPGVTIQTGTESIKAYNYRTSSKGHYLFVDLEISPNCDVKRYPLTVRRNDGATNKFEFEVLDRPSYAQRDLTQTTLFISSCQIVFAMGNLRPIVR